MVQDVAASAEMHAYPAEPSWAKDKGKPTVS
jgi:hypothetical protein